ncbi:MAG: hypothetical protein NDF54_00400 [archaeon GB-1867-035]|nr:hypothetical protein [Candidatus Culexmicrobium profundum]
MSEVLIGAEDPSHPDKTKARHFNSWSKEEVCEKCELMFFRKSK